MTRKKKKALRWKFIALLILIFFLLGAYVLKASAEGGYDEFGYNNKAGIFNGTVQSWCESQGNESAWCASYFGPAAYDKLKINWSSDWDRGIKENWSRPPYNAWSLSQWNGMIPKGTGVVWEYKLKWVGPCTEGEQFPDGGSCIWGQFNAIMDKGNVKHEGHYDFVLSGPNRYGARNSK